MKILHLNSLRVCLRRTLLPGSSRTMRGSRTPRSIPVFLRSNFVATLSATMSTMVVTRFLLPLLPPITTPPPITTTIIAKVATLFVAATVTVVVTLAPCVMRLVVGRTAKLRPTGFHLRVWRILRRTIVLLRLRPLLYPLSLIWEQMSATFRRGFSHSRGQR
ncbi:hypothetical protein EV361DRAFT_942520 [Lentinula raphanica]|nr:hypothetical protein EV361DRAFT_942520 [Lentinula raphanica]